MASENSTFTVRRTGQVSVIEFPDTIADLGNDSARLQDEISSFLFDNDCHQLLIDLKNVSYLPSVLLGVLATIARGGAHTHLVNAAPDIVEVMSITQLNKLMHVNEIDLDRVLEDLDEEDDDDRDLQPTTLIGYILKCPDCGENTKVAKQQLGKSVECGSCRTTIHIDASSMTHATHIYAKCPHCRHELSVARRYLAKKVECKFCNGPLEIRIML